MKHSILALAAALGMAGSAHAFVYLGHANFLANADSIRVLPGGEGHSLIMPYFNAQGTTVTSLSLLNSDGSVAKAVKVHVRGAANGDSLQDFTVLLAPNDVWTAIISKGSDGVPRISSSDASCVLTNDGGTSKPTMTLSLDNLAPYLSDAARKTHAGEGLLEFITMTDIDASPSSSALLDAIKARDCTGAQIGQLLSSKTLSQDEAELLGLRPPPSHPVWQLFCYEPGAKGSVFQQHDSHPCC